MISIIAVIFVWYVFGLIIPRYGVLPSISHSYDELKYVDQEWLFTVFIWSMTTCMAFVLSDSIRPRFIPLIIGTMFLALLGASGNFRDGLSATMHYIGASGAYLCMLGGLWLISSENHQWWFGIWYVIIPLMFEIISKVKKMNSQVLWSESFALSIIIVGLFIYYL